MSDADDFLDLRRGMSLARVLLFACAPPSRERAQAVQAIGEVLALLTEPAQDDGAAQDD